MKWTRNGSVSSLSRCDLWFIPANGMKMNVGPGNRKEEEMREKRVFPTELHTFCHQINMMWLWWVPIKFNERYILFSPQKAGNYISILHLFQYSPVCLSSLTTMDVVIISRSPIPLLFISTILFLIMSIFSQIMNAQKTGQKRSCWFLTIAADITFAECLHLFVCVYVLID